MEQLFAQAGFTTRAQSHGPDGGVDVWLHSRHAQGPVSVVQCKHWRARSVGVEPVRELYGVLAASRSVGAYMVTSGRYTRAARTFAPGRSRTGC